MHRLRWKIILALAGLLAFLQSVQAQQQQQFNPHIGYAYPAGGRLGGAFQVKIGGQFLDGVAQAYISGDGIQATVVEHVKPITQQQFSQLRDKLKELQEKKAAAANSGGKPKAEAEKSISPKPAWTADDEKQIAEIRKKIAGFVRRPSSPAIVEMVTLQVTVAADAEPGERELRLGTPQGLSNPLVFCVGQLPEYCKVESKNDNELRPGIRQLLGRESPSAKPSAEVKIALPMMVNGRIMPGEVDRYRFAARKGQQFVAAASARKLVPYLADAVPGWFQAALTLYDSRGNEVAYAGEYRFDPDPVLHYEIPKSGDYVLEIKDSLYRGREDFVYRVALGELPFVTSIFPLGGPAGTQSSVAVKGWNLPLAGLTQDAQDQGPGIYPLSLPPKGKIFNSVSFAVDSLPECIEQEPNNERAGAQKFALPIIVNGRIDRPGDADVFRFEGRAGEKFIAEVSARRLGSPLDSMLKLTDAAGRQLALNDDYADKGLGLSTHHADSWLTADLPGDGIYYIHLVDAQHKGGAEYAYRLRISAPRPDFALRVVPSAVNARPGMSVPVTVYALRRDSFAGEIALALKEVSPGFTLSGGLVPADRDQVRLTLTVPPAPAEKPVNLQLEGRATIQGREIIRPGVPADDLMQAFIYHHLVPANQWQVTVTGRGRARAPFRLLGETPLQLPADGTATVRFAGPNGPLADQFQLSLNDPPEGITVGNVSRDRNGFAVVLHVDGGKVKPSTQGNLIVDAFLERTVNPPNGKPAVKKQRIPLGTMPAIPFEIEKN